MASSTTSNTSSSSSSTAQSHGIDDYYRYDAAAIAQQRKDKPWENDVKYFKNIRVSALAAMKMLKHALSGVSKGRERGSAPIEIMGLMVGKPDGTSIVVLDAIPLPVEGSETRVVADDAQVYMTNMMESLELRREEGFVGWYHSHPFDVETYSHCHMSAVDVQTQYSWQNSIPTWTAIVVDPLRSLARQAPELGAYRVYPPKHNPPANECPDGSNMTDVTARTTRWGLSYSRYYELPISYFLSSLGKNMVDIMSRDNLWVRVLGSSSALQTEARERFAERVSKAVEKLEAQPQHHHGFRGLGKKKKSAHEELDKGARACGELSIEQCKGQCSQIIKDLLFNYMQRAQHSDQANQTNNKQDQNSDMVMDS